MKVYGVDQYGFEINADYIRAFDSNNDYGAENHISKTEAEIVTNPDLVAATSNTNLAILYYESKHNNYTYTSTQRGKDRLGRIVELTAFWRGVESSFIATEPTSFVYRTLNQPNSLKITFLEKIQKSKIESLKAVRCDFDSQ